MSEKSKVSEGEFSSSPQWLFRRETLTKGVGDKSIVNHHLAECGQEVFRKNLFAHFGCINAIEFSHDGELLVSGEIKIILLKLDIYNQFRFESRNFV